MRRRSNKPSKLRKAAKLFLLEKSEISAESSFEAGFLLALDIIRRMQLSPPTEIAAKLEEFAEDDASRRRRQLEKYRQIEAHERRLLEFDREIEERAKEFFPAFTFPVGRTKK